MTFFQRGRWAWLPLAMVTGFATPVSAQDKGTEAEALFEALGLPQIIEIMQAEGVDYGAQISADLLGGRGADDWDAIVAQIYDVTVMQARAEADFIAALAGKDVAPILAFFSNEPGQSFVSLEIAGRRALLDEDVTAAAEEIAALAEMDNTPRFQLLQEFIQTNDLIESNVVGAMNSNYAFYTGLMAGGALPGDLTQEQILTDVWGQEEEIRTNTREWLQSFLLMAYQPASDADLNTYLAFSKTPAGSDLNTALFAAFDGLFEDISHALGLAAARYMIGQEL